ncbi:MAG: hypothetical protein ACLU5J_04745 [Christensenellales bacterium]
MLTSVEITKHVGSYLFKHIEGLKADVHRPEFTLYLDVRSEGTFIFTHIYLGLGGFPAGSIGKTLLMISGGIDSVVAGYLAIKRGMSIDAIHFCGTSIYIPIGCSKGNRSIRNHCSLYGISRYQFICCTFYGDTEGYL